MKNLILAVVLTSSLLAADRASESVVTSNVKTITRLVSVTPNYTDDSSVILLSITEHTKTFVVLPGGDVAKVSTSSRLWTYNDITNLPTVWTNVNNVVLTNNAYKNNLLGMWTRFDNHPESLTISLKNPGMTYTAP